MDDFNGNNPQQGDSQDSNPQQGYQQSDANSQQDYSQQPNYYQQPDPYNYYQQPPVQPEKKGQSVASMVLGIISITTFCIPFLPIVLAAVALILGIMSMVNKKGGRNLAIAGIICGAVGLVAGIYMGISYVAAFSDPNFADIWSSALQQYQ